ncbi:hypothetical protein KM043_007696 [Ampulex compressa]|nr:hypothetical protein KM043_007696 [Ampulex compressa]
MLTIPLSFSHSSCLLPRYVVTCLQEWRPEGIRMQQLPADVQHPACPQVSPKNRVQSGAKVRLRGLRLQNTEADQFAEAHVAPYEGQIRLEELPNQPVKSRILSPISDRDFAVFHDDRAAPCSRFNNRQLWPSAFVSPGFYRVAKLDMQQRGYASYTCESCGRNYKSWGSLKFHRNVECRKEPSFACTFCIYKSHRRSNLHRHMQLHYRFAR